MANWLISREAVKRAAGIDGTKKDASIDALIQQESDAILATIGRRLLPVTELRNYDWPQRHSTDDLTLYLDDDLQSVTLLTKDDDTATVINATDFFLEYQNEGPPYSKIEIDRASSAFFSFLSTTQRAVRVTGLWGYYADGQVFPTKAAGNLDGALSDTTGTTLAATDGSKIEVGDTLLIESEQCFVSGRTDADMGINTHGSTGAMTVDITDQTLTLVSEPTDAVTVGEILRIGSERVRVEAINTTSSFEVTRSWDGTTLAAHSIGDDVFIFRTFTIERGTNGTTAATHADDTAVTVYGINPIAVEWVRAKALAAFQQDQAAWGREVGAGEGAQEFRGGYLQKIEDRATRLLKRRRLGAV